MNYRPVFNEKGVWVARPSRDIVQAERSRVGSRSSRKPSWSKQVCTARDVLVRSLRRYFISNDLLQSEYRVPVRKHYCLYFERFTHGDTTETVKETVATPQGTANIVEDRGPASG